MPNFELPNDMTATIPLLTTNSAGAVEPIPTGDVFAATSSSASLAATVNPSFTDPKTSLTGPALVLTPMVQVSPAITATVTDSSGLAAFVLTVDIVDDVTATNIVPDLGNVVFTPQPVPTAPGP